MSNQPYTSHYPWSTVAISNAVSLGIYFLGAFLTGSLSVWLLIAFVLYILILEIRLLRYSCVNCYYYGLRCAFGKGKLSALLFRKGDPEVFHRKCITWRTMIPDILISLVPLIAGIVLLITDFRWIYLFAMILIAGLTSAGNGYVRGTLACKHCKQRDLGCPAYELFNKKTD